MRQLLRCIVSHILEHSNCNQVVIDVTSTVASVHVDSIQHGHEVLLAQSIDVVADDELKTAESTGHNLIAFMLQ